MHHRIPYLSNSRLPLDAALEAALAKPIPKTHTHRSKQPQTKEARSPLVMIHHGPAFADFAHTPQVQPGAVDEGETGDEGKGPGSREGETIAKVKERSGDGTEENREFEPGEEGTLGCELDFGFDADGDMDSW